ncbi:MAG: hypothetical protein JSU00_07860 [Acidobacteria bacterium]|nr:hypothetical protein [Acidobacteriota bacterium]
MQSRLVLASLAAFLGVVAAPAARAQTSAATFGEVVQLGGTPSDVVLDETRGRLYLVNTSAARVDVYDYRTKTILGSISVGTTPLAAAMSMDAAYLYVTNNGSSTLSVIDLSVGIGNVSQTVSLTAKPEGVEVGSDGRVLICTDGTGASNLTNTLLIYDRTQSSGQQVTSVQFPPPPVTPTTLPTTTVRPTTTFRGKLQRTQDGSLIVGVSVTNNSASTVLYVYEVASGVVLASRTVTGQSSVLGMAPDGSRFMAGYSLYETSTLNVIAQESTANAPFTLSGSFATTANVGGAVFHPDGSKIYAAFNTTQATTPASRPTASTLLIEDPKNLTIGLGINLPESIVAKLIITSDGADAWGMSESGLIHLPLSKLYDYPILMPETTNVYLAMDDCNRGAAKTTLKIKNIGGGKLTFAVPSSISGGSAAIVAQATSGVAPADLTFTMDPGRSGVTRQPGTNLYSGSGASNNGFAVNLQLASNEAINIPPAIRIYMNYRQSDQRGLIFPVPTVPNSTTEGLRDIVLDESRGRVYLTNSGYNRIEVFDTKNLAFLDPIPVGQLPHQMAMGLDNSTLYVANTGGESIAMVDLDAGQTVDKVAFPAIPRAGNTSPVSPYSIAMGLSGLQIMMSNGTLWKVVAGTASPRPASAVINGNSTSTTQTAIATPTQAGMLGTPDFASILLLNGTGTGYLYDGLSDAFTASRVLFTNPIISYYGALGGGTTSSYLLANGLVMNASLTPIGGATTPGTVTTTQPTQPGQIPTVSVVSVGSRNVAAVAPIDTTTFARMTTPVRTNLTSTTTDDSRTTLEIFDITTKTSTLAGVMPENPVFSVFGTTRQQVAPRQMVVDSQGTVYAITISGLSVMPLASSSGLTKPQIPQGARAVTNSNDGSSSYAPGSFITINGSNLALSATSNSLPVPTVLGGSCVVLNDVPLPLLQTSGGQISAQIPATVRPGLNVLQVRSLFRAQQSDPFVVTVQKAQ